MVVASDFVLRRRKPYDEIICEALDDKPKPKIKPPVNFNYYVNLRNSPAITRLLDNETFDNDNLRITENKRQDIQHIIAVKFGDMGDQTDKPIVYAKDVDTQAYVINVNRDTQTKKESASTNRSGKYASRAHLSNGSR